MASAAPFTVRYGLVGCIFGLVAMHALPCCLLSLCWRSNLSTSRTVTLVKLRSPLTSSCHRAQMRLETVVDRRGAPLHAGGEMPVAVLLGGMRDRAGESRHAVELGEDDGNERIVAGKARREVSLRVDEARWRHDLAIDARHRVLRPVGAAHDVA